jgi:membrane-bound serine protease (ClpP class)
MGVAAGRRRQQIVRILRVLVCLGAFSTGASHTWAQAAKPVAIVAELDGIIHPIAVEYLEDAMARADASNAEVLIIVLRTPGGLLDSTREIVSRMIASRAPVVVFVGPSGARAASAGFVITIAADVAVMAPGTHIGAAHPVSGTGQQMDETTANKAASDAAAYVRALAQARGRNVELSSEAVMESRAFTADEAVGASPRLVDFIARDLDEVLRELDGRMVRRFDGRTATIHTAGADVRRIEMTWRQRVLGWLAHPQVAYLLLTLGMLGLTVELWNPGSIAPGVAGGLCLLLAFFAFQIVPVNVTGLLLILFGVGLLVAELTVPSFGILGIGGTISLLIGSVMLTRAVPGVTVSLGFVVPIAIATAAIMLFLGRLALGAQRQPAATGIEAMVGQLGRARTPLSPDGEGHIDIRGEIWRAFSPVPVQPGQLVRVREVNGLTLLVEPAGPSAHEGDHQWT